MEQPSENEHQNSTSPLLRSLGDKQPVMVPPTLDGARVIGVRPTRDVTQEEIETFWRDGVVKLEGILPVESVSYLGDVFENIFHGYETPEDAAKGGAALGKRLSNDLSTYAEEVLASGKGEDLLVPGGFKEGETTFTGRAKTEISCFNWHTDFHRFCAQGPLPEAIAQLLGSKKLQYYNDQLFYKEAGSLLQTGFHQDGAAFPLQGERIAICWVSPDVVTRESGCMRYIKGSHRWKHADGSDGVFQMSNLVKQKGEGSQMVEAEYEAKTGIPALPDFEHEEHPDTIYHEAKPGDVIVHHNHTIHGSQGNASDRHRRGASIRYVGDEVVYGHQLRSMWSGAAYSSATAESPMAKAIAQGKGLKGFPDLDNKSKKDGDSSSAGVPTDLIVPKKEKNWPPKMGMSTAPKDAKKTRTRLTPGEPLPDIPAFPVVWPRNEMPSFARL